MLPDLTRIKYLTTDEIIIQFLQLPEDVTELDLSNCNLGERSPVELINIFSALPKTVISLNLTGNFVGKQDLQILLILFFKAREQVSNVQFDQKNVAISNTYTPTSSSYSPPLPEVGTSFIARPRKRSDYHNSSRSELCSSAKDRRTEGHIGGKVLKNNLFNKYFDQLTLLQGQNLSSEEIVKHIMQEPSKQDEVDTELSNSLIFQLWELSLELPLLSDDYPEEFVQDFHSDPIFSSESEKSDSSNVSSLADDESLTWNSDSQEFSSELEPLFPLEPLEDMKPNPYLFFANSTSSSSQEQELFSSIDLNDFF